MPSTVEDEYDRVEDLLFDLLVDWFSKHTKTRRRDMPNNLAHNLRRDFERLGLTVAKVPSDD